MRIPFRPAKWSHLMDAATIRRGYWSAFFVCFHGMVGSVCLAAVLLLTPSGSLAADLRVMKTGLGSGNVTSSPAGISCGTSCDATFAGSATVTLVAAPDPGSTFVGWDQDPDFEPGSVPDCSGTAGACTLSMSTSRAVRPMFRPAAALPALSDFAPEGIQTYLTAHPAVTSAAQFLSALPDAFKQNWILMARSESLQTGIAQFPRVLLPSLDDRLVFTIAVAEHGSYPAASAKVIEYMQWDAADKNFRFHEIVLDNIPTMGAVPARARGVSIDDVKCSKCHSTQNVLNRSSLPGTTGIPPGTVKAKSKPNWDAYDSWGGMLPFNRDRIYQGSLDAAAIRTLFNPWTWRTNADVRSFVEQLRLQPPGAPAQDRITRLRGGANDGRVKFAFDPASPVTTEPAPVGPESITTSYAFNGAAGAGAGTNVTRAGTFVRLQHPAVANPDEGRGVQLFDLLGGLDGQPNAERIADELANHRFATGSVPIDVRPVALAIFDSCITFNPTTNSVASTSPLTVDFGFFNARNGMGIGAVVADTRTRAQSLPRRKADIQKLDGDRTGDPYIRSAPPPAPANGEIQQYGAATSAGTAATLARHRQEVFRRRIDAGVADATVMGAIYVDRELYSSNTNKISLARYFLEPLGVSVDKWSMGVRGRSRTYTFADVLTSNENVIITVLRGSLGIATARSDPGYCPDLISRVNTSLAALPPAIAVPTYTDVQLSPV
jgi:hypothetical protein